MLNTKQATINQLLEGVQAYADAMRETETEYKYIMTPDRWLERSCWSNTLESYTGENNQDDYYNNIIKQYKEKYGDDK